MATSRRTCTTVPQPSELPFRMMRPVGRGIAVLRGVHIMQGEGDVLGFFFPIFTMGNAITSPTVKCFRFVYENLTFPFGKGIVGNSIRWLFGYIRFQDPRRGLWKISKKVTIFVPKFSCTQQNVAARAALTAAADGQLARSWVNATAHYSASYNQSRRGPFPNYFGQTCLY